MLYPILIKHFFASFEYTDEKGNLHSGTESFYNHNNRPEYDKI